MIEPTRRGFIRGMGLLFAAPAIVRASSLMPVKNRDEIIGYNIYRSPSSYNANSLSHAVFLEPGDIVKLGTISYRIMAVTEQSNGLLAISADRSLLENYPHSSFREKIEFEIEG